MRPVFLTLGLALLLPMPAHAQVVVNPAALAQLAGIAPPARAAKAVTPPRLRVIAQRRAWPRGPARGIAEPKAYPPAPVLAVAKPSMLPAPAPKPKLTTTPKPRPKPRPKPTPSLPPTPVTIDFAAGSAALPAGAMAVLHPYCQAGGVVGIDARAPADADNPSAAMRLSLNRALAVRGALLACGVSAADIIPRADGAVPGQDDNQTVLTEAEK